MKDVYTLADLRFWQAAAGGENPPLKLAVFGDPIAHSLSPQMHNAALEEQGIEARYCRMEIPVANLEEGLRRIRDNGFIGANLTIPHKIEVLPFLDEIDSDALRLGAVNTVVIEPPEEGGRFLGFNTDGPGIARSIRADFDVDVSDLRVMILGAGGGAGRAAAVQCAMEGCQRLVLVNRSIEKLQPIFKELKTHFADDRVSGPSKWIEICPWEDDALKRQLDYIDLIINATSLGMKRTDPIPVPKSLLQAHHLIYDIVYGKGQTKLLRAAEEAGARGANGLSMLLYQGALSYEIWFDRAAPVATMKRALWHAAGLRFPGDVD